MARTTNPGPPNDVTQFYDRLAGGYDAMTGFEERFAKERPLYQNVVERHGVATAIDAGAGTGFHSLLLAQLGVSVTAVDLSPRMLNALSEHAAAMGVSVQTRAGNLADLASLIASPVDAVFALGNTLAHLLSPDDLASVLKGIHAVLRPGGLFVSQLLNYRRILATRPDVINVREADGSRFTRRYEYGASRIRFMITREDMSGRVPPETVSVELYPLTTPELEAALHAAGFTVIERYDGIAMKPFEAETSADLLLLARRR